MGTYEIIIVAEVRSSLARTELETQLVASLVDVETGEKVSDGDGEYFQVVDYSLTQATPVDDSKR